jgi:DNA-binding MarR family transcriptional regulator
MRFDSPEQEIYLGLWRTYDRLRALEDELFGQYELTAQQYNALRLLRGAHPEKLATLDLAARLISRAPDITRLVDRLEGRGLVERERMAEDRRSVRIGLTQKGSTLLAELDHQVRDCHRRQLGHLTADEKATLKTLLQRARRPHENDASPWR